jgi:hypothetical protein
MFHGPTASLFTVWCPFHCAVAVAESPHVDRVRGERQYLTTWTAPPGFTDDGIHRSSVKLQWQILQPSYKCRNLCLVAPSLHNYTYSGPCRVNLLSEPLFGERMRVQTYWAASMPDSICCRPAPVHLQQAPPRGLSRHVTQRWEIYDSNVHSRAAITVP